MLGHKETKDNYIWTDIVMIFLCAFSSICFVLKIAKVITWSWWWILTPILTPFVLMFGFTLLVGVVLVICGIIGVICGR